MARRASTHLGERIIHVPVRLQVGRYFGWAPALASLARDGDRGLVHAWGIEAARACSAMLRDRPLVLTLLDPAPTRNVARWVRSFPKATAIVAGSQVIRSRLITAGIAPDRIVVVRGAVEFAAINAARGKGIRRNVAGDARPVLLMGGPPSRAGGQYYGLWAAAIVKQVHPELTVVLPYESAERRRLVSFVEQLQMPSLLTLPDARLTWPELVTCADVFLMPAVDEVCTEPLGSAMAAGLVVVGAAVRSIAEIIADRSNGLLSGKAEARPLAARIMTALEDKPLCRQVTEAARGQAFEVFSTSAFANNYQQVYQNVLAGNPTGDGVRDTAMVA